MNLSELSAVSPIDGRYRNKIEELGSYFSEFALIKYRLEIEVRYFIELLPIVCNYNLNGAEQKTMQLLLSNFDEKEAQIIKEIEKTTNHDVKAVEYYIKQKLENTALSKYSEWIHFGLTSQDINNTAVPLSLKHALNEVINPKIETLIDTLKRLANDWKDIPMLAKTHGQPATPTYLGKEILVFAERLQLQVNSLKKIPIPSKFGGATGNFNAHYIAFSEVDWQQFANDFINNHLGLHRSFPTTQIEHYDYLAAIFDNLRRINVILIDFARDIWTYISMDYFKQKVISGEVGSSAMPHKVNPIDFENAEGNLGIANALYNHLAEKLPISRLQRDLTDSTVLRNIGVPLAHSLIAFKSLEKGISKLIVNKEALHADLDANWAVIAEAIQTILRRENYPKPYEKLKELTRGKQKLNATDFATFINSLEVEMHVKQELLNITPFNFTGFNPL